MVPMRSFCGATAQLSLCTTPLTTGVSDSETGGTFNLIAAPGAGQTYPAKFNFDVSSAPSCTLDYVAMGIPSQPVAGGQANLVGLINLYTDPSNDGFCSGTGPSFKFAYASGTGEIPSSVSLSQFGTQIAYVENLLSGRSYFHVLTIGTTGNNGSSAITSAVPGVGNNAVDTRVLLSPDGGTTVQSSTSSPFIVYNPNDVNDVAYVTTYSTAGTGSGYLYKLANVFSGSATPTIVWSVPITAIPSTPVYDSVSNKIFLADSAGRIDSVVDTGSVTPTVNYGPVVAAGTTSENPVVVDSTNQMVYATFNSDGTNAVVVQAPTDLLSSVSVPVGIANTTFGAPYAPDFNNDFYNGGVEPLLYVAGTGSTGARPTLYGVSFTAAGKLKTGGLQTTRLTTNGTADSSPVTEFYNTTLNKEFMFVGVTDHCKATTNGGTAGCIMSLDITGGFPTVVKTTTTALAATGGTTGIIVDNTEQCQPGIERLLRHQDRVHIGQGDAVWLAVKAIS